MATHNLAASTDDPPQPTEFLDMGARAMTSAAISKHVDSLHRLGYTHDGLLQFVRSEIEEFERDRDIHPKLGDQSCMRLAAAFQLILEQRTAYHRASA